MATLINKIKNSKKRIMFGFFFENVARRVVCEVSRKGSVNEEIVVFNMYREMNRAYRLLSRFGTFRSFGSNHIWIPVMS